MSAVSGVIVQWQIKATGKKIELNRVHSLPLAKYSYPIFTFHIQTIVGKTYWLQVFFLSLSHILWTIMKINCDRIYYYKANREICFSLF